jgi:DNA-binding MarR family transcriptional regulator
MQNRVEPAERIADLLDRLALHQRSRQQGDGLNPAQWEALRFLGRANRYSRNPTALTDFLGTTKGTVSQTLIALERKRLVTREPDRRDRRSIRIELTPAGRQLLGRDPMQNIAGAAASGTASGCRRARHASHRTPKRRRSTIVWALPDLPPLLQRCRRG